jgi:hypothetical protein
MTEFLFEGSNHGSSDLVFLIISYNHESDVEIAYAVELFKVVSLLCTGLSALIIPFLNSMKVPLSVSAPRINPGWRGHTA